MDVGYDARRETLVMETRTHWDPSVAAFPLAERRQWARELHAQPQSAAQVGYERTHTGFIRVITLTAADVARLKGEVPPSNADSVTTPPEENVSATGNPPVKGDETAGTQ